MFSKSLSNASIHKDDGDIILQFATQTVTFIVVWSELSLYMILHNAYHENVQGATLVTFLEDYNQEW